MQILSLASSRFTFSRTSKMSARLGRVIKTNAEYPIKKALRPIKFYIKSLTVAKTFLNYFEVTSELSNEDFDAMCRLRHEVYCKELGFAFNSQEEKELDQYDKHAKFCVVKRKSTGEVVGAVRFVVIEQANHSLPIESTCNTYFEDCALLPQCFNSDEVAEVSRLVIAQKHRKKNIKGRTRVNKHYQCKKSSDKTTKYEKSATDFQAVNAQDRQELKNFKFIAVALYLGTMIIAKNTNRPHGFIITTPQLARSLACFGIQLKRIGHLYEYTGMRAPYYIDGEKTQRKLHGGFKRFLNVIETSMA
ncbi:PEP-CTERM/exosortase system-associated acyltransferase [Agaribacter marinus]|uniref:N-acyl amino acid synthase, PEP-CTERM/exosortase system-associated n=1 Tax=Agaribacter marinus TaxID=1431249 RepID=A0AA37SWD0_9ALTE|nr:PEP-CTERM/exosortase system-associated acyltransferase [Agaribacter marinus]GLR70357.1 hypothetical protein GCM10007852_12650 [Agaribacter marinus]